MNEHEMLKNRFRDRVFKGKTPETRAAIELAYADMSRRQNGHLPAMKEACINWLVNNVFTGKIQFSDYDTWHETQCNELIKIWNDIKPNFGTVGKAQKVLNMAFKYLSCITEDYNAILQYCHMTLDSYTLAWYKAVVMPWAQKNGRPDVESLVEWSKIKSYGDYKLIQKNIRDYLSTGAVYSIKINKKSTKVLSLPIVPIDAEFVVWEGQIIKERYTNLIKELDHYIHAHRGNPAGKDYDTWLLDDLFDDYIRDYCKTT